VPKSLRIPSYRFHKASGQAIVVLRGRSFYLGKWDSPESHAEYRRVIGEWCANGQRSPEPPSATTPAPLTIDELILAYWEHARAYYVKDGKPTSEQDTLRQALRPLRQLYGNMQAKDFGPLALRAVRQAMIDRGWCRTHINKQVNRVRRLFAWAVSEEFLKNEVHGALTKVPDLQRNRTTAREKPPVGPVPDDIIERTLPFLSPTVATIVRLQRLTAMRPQEVILMRGTDIDRSDPECWAYRPTRHKSQHHERQRLVFLGPRSQELLRPFLEAVSPNEYLFSPKRAEQERRAEERARRKSPMTPSQRARQPKPNPKRAPGDLYDGGAYRKAIRRACKKLCIPIWFPHQLRHSAASEIRRRYGLEATQSILGHTELTTTQIYAQADRGRAYEIMKEIG
jgi:integrase